jgi:dihydrolipoamide dehydrogenase
MSGNPRFDVVVIGGGPAGYVAAIRAGQLGLRTALVEREHLGGICLNWGCIPTKALLRSAEVFELLQDSARFGVHADNVRFDLHAMVGRSREISAQLRRGVAHLLKKNHVCVHEGTASLAGAQRVEVTGATGRIELQATHIVIATGARARSVEPLVPDGKLVWTYKEAMTPAAVPKSIVVAGSGAIGVEFASFYRSLGSEVTLVEMQGRILPLEDEDVSRHMQRAFEKRGIRCLTGARVTALDKKTDSVNVKVEQGGATQRLAAERVISAIGIVGNVENLGLESTLAIVRNSHIETDKWGRTAQPGVYAIGDVAGAPWLAHKASHEAVLCVEHLAERPGVHPLDVRRIPACTYSHPQVASIGVTEAQARAEGHDIKVGRFSLGGNGRALALGDADGFVKTIFDRASGALLGAHLVGPDVSELVQGYAIAMTLETTEEELQHTVFPHPTLSEAMHEAVLAADGRALHA